MAQLDLKAEAYSYWRMGFNVVALFFEDKGGKVEKRAFIEWGNWHRERQTEEEFHSQPWDRADGFGVVCSYPNRDGLYLAVVDYDVKKVSEEAKAKGKALLSSFPVTQMEETVSGGIHLVYLSRVKPSRSISEFHGSHGLELIATGKLVVMAPSRGYRRLNDNPPTVVEDAEALFYQVLGVEDKRGKVNEGLSEALLQKWLEQLKPRLKVKGEGSQYIYCHCPFHPPDNHPSFAINKQKFYAVDYHDNKVYSLKELAEGLGVRLEGAARPGVIELGDVQVQPLFNGLSRKVHPAIGVVDGVAYVSVSLPCLVHGNGKAHEKELPFLITSDRRRVLCHPKVLEGLKWKLEYSVVHFSNRWSLSSIQGFLEGSESVNPREVYFMVKNAWLTYLEFPDARVYKFLTLWCIGTYFFHLFNAYPYIFLQGVKKSGKTKILTVASFICFNAIFSNNMSTSSIFRLIQSGRCTLLLDEAEKFSTKERAQEIRNLLLSGYKKGAKVYRTEKTGKERLVPESFEVYSPKMLASISGYEDVLEDRGFLIVTKRGRNRAIMNREPKDDDTLWQTIRDKLYVFYLTYFNEVSEVSERVKLSGKASGREGELAKPILALAHFFHKFAPEENLPEEITAFLEEKFREKETENMTETGELILVKVLVRLVKSEGYYKTKDILAEMAGEFDEKPEWLNSKWVGRAMKRLGFMEKRRVGTGVEYRLTPEAVNDLAERLGAIGQEEAFPLNFTPSLTSLTPPEEGDESFKALIIGNSKNSPNSPPSEVEGGSHNKDVQNLHHVHPSLEEDKNVEVQLNPPNPPILPNPPAGGSLKSPALLSRENIERVWEALVEASKERGSAHASEVAVLSGLQSEAAEAILHVLEREGRAYSPYAGWWKPVFGGR